MYKDLFIYYAVGISSVVIISMIVYSISSLKNYHTSSRIIYIIIGLSVYMPFAQYFKFSNLHFYVDFSHWLKVLYNLSTNGKPLNLSQELLVPGAMNYFSVHFVPLLYLLALPFKLWPYGEIIIILNFLLMLSAVIPLYKLALHINKDKQFGLLISAILLWYPTFQYTVLYEFEMLRFSIPVILWMLYFWEKKFMKLYFLFAFLATMIREEVGLTIMMFGLYLLLIEKEKRVGVVTVLIGLGTFAVITQGIMPTLRTTADYRHVAAGSFSRFGITFSEIIINIIKHPEQVIIAVIQPIKLANIFMLFLPLLFIPFLSPTVLMSTFANLGVVLMSESPTHSSYMLYYLSQSVPFIFYAFIKGWRKFLEIMRFCADKWHVGERKNVNSMAMVMMLSGIIVANVFFGPSPISFQFWSKGVRPAPFKTQDFHYSAYKITDHHRKVKEFEKLIPDSAIVSAQHFLHSELFRKKATMIYPQLESFDGNIKADYVFFDKTNNGLKNESPAYLTNEKFGIVEKDNKSWKLVKSEDGYYLYERIHSDTP